MTLEAARPGKMRATRSPEAGETESPAWSRRALEKPSLALNRQRARDSEALDIDGGAIALTLRIDSEFLGQVTVGAVAAVRRTHDFSQHRLPRFLRELETERVVDLCDRSNWVGDE